MEGNNEVLHRVQNIQKGQNNNKMQKQIRQNATGYFRQNKSHKFQLPKISRTMFLESDRPSFQLVRYNWLKQDRDYSELPLTQIQQQYKMLRNELLIVNEQAAKSVDVLKTQTYKKKKPQVHPKYYQQICNQEIENNNSILARLRQQLEKLQTRQNKLQLSGKDQLDELIKDILVQIDKTKQQIKTKQQKSKAIGLTLVGDDQIFEEIKYLEVEKQISQRKRTKLSEKLNEVQENQTRITKQLDSIRKGAAVAEDMIMEEMQFQKEERQQKSLGDTLRHKQFQCEALRKNIQSIKQLKTIKYHEILRYIQQLTKRSEKRQQQIYEVERQNLIIKKQIQQNQISYKEIKNLRHSLIQQSSVLSSQKPTTERRDNTVRNRKIIKMSDNHLQTSDIEAITKSGTKSQNKNYSINLNVKQLKMQVIKNSSPTVKKEQTQTLQSGNSNLKKSKLFNANKKEMNSNREYVNKKSNLDKRNIKTIDSYNGGCRKSQKQQKQLQEGKQINQQKNHKKRRNDTDFQQKSYKIQQKIIKKEQNKIQSNIQVQQQIQISLNQLKFQQKNNINQHLSDQINIKESNESKKKLDKKEEVNIQLQLVNVQKSAEIKLNKEEPKDKDNKQKQMKQGIDSDKYIEQFQKQVKNQKNNLNKGVKLTISLNDIQKKIQKKQSSSKKQSYGSIEQQLIPEESDLQIQVK